MRWFSKYNKSHSYAEQVKPFNFLLSFQPNFAALIAAISNDHSKSSKATEFDARDLPKPVAPYSKKTAKAARQAFDRITGKPVPRGHLTGRRHIKVDIADIHYIGKESNEFEEQFYLGFDQDDEVPYGKEADVDVGFLELVRQTDKEYRRRRFAKVAGISVRHLTEIVAGRVRLTRPMIAKLKRAMERLDGDRKAREFREAAFLTWGKQEVDQIGLRELARRLCRDPANLAKVLDGKRRPTEALTRVAEQLKGSSGH